MGLILFNSTNSSCTFLKKCFIIIARKHERISLMTQFLKSYYKTLMFFAVIGLLGGFFTGLYVLESYPEELQEQLIDELNAAGLGGFPIGILMGVITAFQSAAYGLVLGAVGIWLGKKTGLWKDERSIARKPLAFALGIAFIGGLVMILSDILFFGNFSEAIMVSYAVKPTLVYMLATVTYGAVIEEVMVRLFFMSLIAFALHKLLSRHEGKPATALLIAANVISAILFAAGHLPATLLLIGNSPIIIARCFLLNGGLGLLFGLLYRKYGLRYAMIAHGGCHIVSKLIWILFL